MTGSLHPVETAHTPESLVERLQGERGVVLLRSRMFESAQGLVHTTEWNRFSNRLVRRIHTQTRPA